MGFSPGASRAPQGSDQSSHGWARGKRRGLAPEPPRATRSPPLPFVLSLAQPYKTFFFTTNRVEPTNRKGWEQREMGKMCWVCMKGTNRVHLMLDYNLKNPWDAQKKRFEPAQPEFWPKNLPVRFPLFSPHLYEIERLLFLRLDCNLSIDVTYGICPSFFMIFWDRTSSDVRFESNRTYCSRQCFSPFLRSNVFNPGDPSPEIGRLRRGDVRFEIGHWSLQYWSPISKRGNVRSQKKWGKRGWL